MFEGPLTESLLGRASLRERLSTLASYQPGDRLLPALARKLYGEALRTSVSAVEKFAACPFQFFVHSGLGGEERTLFEVDARERGSFQHEVLARFHQRVRDSGRRWRDLSPQQARELVGEIAREVKVGFREGLFKADACSRFAADALAGALQDFIEMAVAWLAHNQFDPHAVEVAFAANDPRLPAWEIDLGNGCHMTFRGKVDRVDLFVDAEQDSALCVVVDYKSGRKKIEPVLLEHGIQIQLPAYLAALCQMRDPRSVFGVGRLEPAGMFYVNLRGSYESGQTRRDALRDPMAARRDAYKHFGRFSLHALRHLDTANATGGSGQFPYALKQDGTPNRQFKDLLERDEFTGLLDHVRRLLVGMGRRIYAGDAKVDPYWRSAEDKACDHCLCQAICRIDSRTHQFRVLKSTKKLGKTKSEIIHREPAASGKCGGLSDE